MRVLLIHRHFWPDAPPYASMLRTIGRRLVGAGHDVTVLSAQPDYVAATAARRRPPREHLDGMDVHRMRLLSGHRHRTTRRLCNLVLFLVQVCWRVATRRDDVVMFSTAPPVALGLVVRGALALSGRAGRYVYHCQDIHPEAAVAGGVMHAGWPYRLLRRIDTATCRNAAAVVVLSNDMRETMLERGIDPAHIEVRNNFAEPGSEPGSTKRAADLRSRFGAEPGSTNRATDDAIVALPPDLLPSRRPGAYVVVFAGNLGRFQQLDTLIEAAWLLRDAPDVQWWIVGDGVLHDDLRRRAGSLVGDTVHFLGYQPPAVACNVVAEADLAVVSLRPGMHRVAFPSKTMTALMAGCRVLAVADPDSDLARTVREAGVGSDVRPGDPAALVEAIRRERRLGRSTARARARSYALEHFSAEVACDAWVRLFKRIADEVTT